MTTQTVAGPLWARNLPVYEVNLDVYGFPKGAALREYLDHLPVLKELGVGLIWFMPVYPRGQKRGFGSPYSVRDYRAINPDLGTKEDFRRLVQTAHLLGMRVLMDWVPNHTAWDNAMIDEHPEFYARNEAGQITQAGPWADVAQLDYGRPGRWNMALWEQMRDDMAYWVREFNVDGFRCDVAGRGGKVPREFWTWLRPQLDAVRPVFMLAEADDAWLHPAFDMTYGWNLWPALWDVCAGRKPATAITEELEKDARKFPSGAIRMHFLDNHDWHPHADWGWGNGTPIDTKDGLPQVAPLMLLCATLPGKPLLYNGQEMQFVKTDPPRDAGARRQSPVWPFYRRLLQLYGGHPAVFEGAFTKIATDHDDTVLAFLRRRGEEQVVVVVNLSGKAVVARPSSAVVAGRYSDWFAGGDVQMDARPSWELGPWGYLVYVSKPSS